jgi:hypothetical protein
VKLNEVLTKSPKQGRATQDWVNKTVKVNSSHPMHADKEGVVRSVSKDGEWVYVKIPKAKDIKGRPMKEVPFKAESLTLKA